MSKESVFISVVTPVYLAEEYLEELIDRLNSSLKKMTKNFEIILVNDNSPDDSWSKMVQLSGANTQIKCIDLSKNFGQHFAISAGLANVRGEWVVVMDCDLQDPPEEIPVLLEKALEGWHVVQARRMKRKDGFFKRVMSNFFYKVFIFLSGLKIDGAVANFGVYNRKVIKEYNRMPEAARSFPSLIQFLGFKSTTVDVEHSMGAENNRSSYNFRKLLRLGGDIILANSNRPLRLIINFGFILSILSFLMAAYNILAYYLGFISVAGFTTTVFSIWFIGGLILTVLGVLGLYVGKIFSQVKERPLYIIQEKINLDD